MLRSRLLHDVPHAFTDIAVGDLRPSAEGFEARAAGLVAAIGGRGPLVSVSQVHGDRVVQAGDVEGGTEADAIVSTLPGQVVAVRVADCVPILMVARAGTGAGAVVAVHAGWRGTADGIAERGLEALCRASGASPHEVRAAIGPAICMGCYEVGSEVVEGLARVVPGGTASEAWMRPTRPGHALVDVRAVNAAILRARGVAVDVLTACTRCARAGDAPVYWSHRRDPAHAGRQAGVVALPG